MDKQDMDMLILLLNQTMGYAKKQGHTGVIQETKRMKEKLFLEAIIR